MDSPTLFLLAADAILLLHALFVGFVVVGLVLILVGKARAWSWVRNPWFRVAHLVAIGVVVLQSWFGAICPLTTLETTLRSRAGEAAYAGSFVAHWLEILLYYRVPPWVFVVCYTAFGAVVVASWFWVRPRRPS
jgi:multisubunit Na+/H+ antiporter MnhB subunit